ncbi:RNA 3'-terminal phosphate cyclase-like protein [Astathelohania contejeani]|uniref:RNA 3'-terminal phosphate cyclase-like protein n=1 Tax=Astathelohania contejeani TaxID=164912 RepID=A0ABQ7HXU4_9MICR|nr:RNA 3'-terminal phosphate cyclase-like protein [Thelohania contejeani]
MIKFDSDDNIEYTVIFSLLSGKEIQIRNVKETLFLKSFLGLIKLITANTSYHYSNGILDFMPGVITGGEIKYLCSNINMSSYIVPLLILAPFTRIPLQLTLTGITNGSGLSIDVVRLVHLRILKMFNIENIELRINKRGFAPEGKGEIYLSVGNVNKLPAIECIPDQLVKIRGIAISSHINSFAVKTIAEIVKEELSDLCSNIKIYSDVSNKNESGPSPGYQAVLFAEGKNTIYYSETIGSPNSTPKETAINAIKLLLKSIDKSRSFDHKIQYFVFSFMALTTTDPSKVVIKRLSSMDKNILESLNRFFNFSYSIERRGEELVFISLGTGFSNYMKVVK